MSAADKTTLTLPMPVTAAVSWDDVRAYLRVEGWRQEPAMPDMWLAPDHGHNGSRCVLLGSAPGDEERRLGVAVSWMAHLASVSPGEMLARIASRPTPPSVDAAVRAAFRVMGPAQSPTPPDSITVLLTVTHADDVRRAAEDMRERAASEVGLRAAHEDDAAVHDALAKARDAIRALPIVANDAAPETLCVPGCARREAEGAGHPGACREKV